MWILPLLGYVGIAFGFTFLTLAIASGLYYLSELVEEHTVITKKILARLIQAIMLVQVLLWMFDGFPLMLSVFTVFSHFVYSLNLRKFPLVQLTDIWFLSSCVLVVANHFLWFNYFTEYHHEQLANVQRNQYNYNYEYVPGPKFSEISSFFGICVWLVPFSLFVSLSAGENVLPSTSEFDSDGSDGKGKKKQRTGMFKQIFESTWNWIGETAGAMGVGKVTGRRPSTFN